MYQSGEANIYADGCCFLVRYLIGYVYSDACKPQSAVLVTGAPVPFPLKRRFSAMARCSGAALDHCQVLASLKSAEASRALRVAISLGV
jgi:hypothetical protein